MTILFGLNAMVTESFLAPKFQRFLMLRYTCVRKYSQAAAAAIQVCLPFTDLKKAKMILLLVLHQGHWSVYCVNFVHTRIDVLDSRDYTSHGSNSWHMYHGQLGKK